MSAMIADFRFLRIFNRIDRHIKQDCLYVLLAEVIPVCILLVDCGWKPE